MAGHSHWAGIKRAKGVTDQKRGQLFSKLCAAITVAARTEPNPDFNPRLRTAVQKARESSVPLENIERAIRRASESAAGLEEVLLEAYGPGGIAILIEAVTDNRNRTIPQVKKILNDLGGKWAETGSVLWGFERVSVEEGWKPRFPQEITAEEADKLGGLVEALDGHDDVQRVTTNAA